MEDLLRELAPQVLGILARRYGQFDAAEDAVQEALIAAAAHWSRDGVPESPRGWLLQTAERRMVDAWRSDRARRHREELAAREPPAPEISEEDDALTVLFLCFTALYGWLAEPAAVSGRMVLTPAGDRIGALVVTFEDGLTWM